MSDLLTFIGAHPWLTVILIMVIGCFTVDIINAIRGNE